MWSISINPALRARLAQLKAMRAQYEAQVEAKRQEVLRAICAGHATKERIRERVEVTQRTLYRYLAELEARGCIVQWRRFYYIPAEGFTINKEFRK